MHGCCCGRQRQESEDEAKEAKRVAEKRYNEEIETLRVELQAAKRKIDELTAETDATKRRLMLSKEDGKRPYRR
jgi:predicted RNase H-like nuclease (RuvC/YqgF family)